MSERKYPISDGAKYILEALTLAGYEAYTVGGAVRDILLGKEPYDYDITTSATPERVKEIFSHLKTVDTGIKHGTVTVLYGGASYEVTTYRTESGYADNRHPDSVSFTSSLDDDLSRRDFTVNAMCIGKDGELYDIYGGQSDLEKGIIRTVGEAERRFSEDALRILRALRFSSKLDFEIEEKTSLALYECGDLLFDISGERIYAEIQKLLMGEGAVRVLTDYSEIILKALPSLSEIKIICPEAFKQIPPREKLIALYILGADGDYTLAIEKLFSVLHTDLALKKCALAVGGLLKMPMQTNRDLLKMLASADGEYVASALMVAYALGIRKTAGTRELEAILTMGIPTKTRELKINGNDLIAHGFKGENIGKMLSHILALVIDGELDNDREALLKHIEMQTNIDKNEV